MSSEPLSKIVSDRICHHMNSDHSEAVIAYAKHYGGLQETSDARMVSITSTEMRLEVDNQLIEIEFDHELCDSEDAHQTLVKMLRSIPRDSS